MLLDRIGEDQVGRAGRIRDIAGNVAHMPLQRFERIARVESHQIAVAKTAGELARIERGPKAAQMREIVEQDKQFERAALLHDVAADSFEDFDFGRRCDLERDDPGVGGIAEQKPVL